MSLGNYNVVSFPQAVIFLSALNFPMFLGLRIAEIIIAAVNILFFNNTQRIIILFLSIFLLMNALYGLNQANFPQTERLIFIFKYIVPFWALFYGINEKKSNATTVLIIYLILLSTWTILYPYLALNGIITGYWRPSFPSDDYSYSDAHLLAAVLATVLAFTLISQDVKNNAKNFNYWVLLSGYILVALIAIVFTGSRNGILIFFLTLIYLFWVSTYYRVYIIIASLGATLVFWFFVDLDTIITAFAGFERLINSDLANDASVGGRLNKIRIGITETLENHIVFGRSIVNGSLIWYDNGPTIMFVHFGVLALFAVFAAALYFSYWLYTSGKFSRKKSDVVFFALLIIITNLITEFFLTTRYACPVFYCFGILINEYRK